MKTKIKYLLGASIFFLLTGCAANMSESDHYDIEPYDASSRGESSSGDYYEPRGKDTSTTADTETTTAYHENGSGNGQTNLPRAGQVTCSVTDDNSDYTYWNELIAYKNGNNRYSSRYYSGVFGQYANKFAFKTNNRLELNVINGNDVKVTIKNTQIQAYADNFHKVYLFPETSQTNYQVEISYVDSNNQNCLLEQTVSNGQIIDLGQTFTTSNNLQIMFVIDATGSMGDEIKYLQAEIDDVITKVKEDNQSANIQLAIMMYRDLSDEYVMRYSDFTTDVEYQKAFLAEQKAQGGDDFEEAVDEALATAMNKQWDPNATKLLFHVADAPAHDSGVPKWNTATRNASSKGIKIFPVASSGIDMKTEYFFRCESILTGGQYVFITDNSGIGGSHKVAETEHPLTVEYLNSCLVRLINGYFKGVMTQPVAYYSDNRA